MQSITESVRLSNRLRQRRFLEKERRRLHGSLIANGFRVVGSPAEFLFAVADEGGEALLAGGTRALKSAVGRALRRQQIIHPATTHGSTPRTVYRPTWTIRKQHRPSVYPSLVPRAPASPSLLPIQMIYAEAEARLNAGEQRHLVLDWLQSITGRPWSWCAQVLGQLGFSLSQEYVEMVAAARNFWNSAAKFCGWFKAAVALGELQEASGDWAFVEHPALTDWLPGLHVPGSQQRERYTVKLLMEGAALDFHSCPHYLPLFTVPLAV